MFKFTRILGPLILFFSGSATVSATESSAAEIAQLLTDRLSSDIVSIELTSTLHANVGGRVLPPRTRRVSASGVVISSRGLSVTALSAIDPRSAFRTSQAVGGGGPASGTGDVSSELKELKIVMPDGRALPARIAGTDETLDLAFILPENQEEFAQTKASYVALTDTAQQQLLVDYYVLSRGSKALGRVLTFRPSALIGVVETPRRVFLLGTPIHGAPVFDSDGRVLGIVTQFILDGLEWGYVVLPAAEIAKRAQAVPEYTAP